MEAPRFRPGPRSTVRHYTHTNAFVRKGRKRYRCEAAAVDRAWAKVYLHIDFEANTGMPITLLQDSGAPSIRQ